MKTQRGVEVKIHHSDVALDAGEWSASSLNGFTSGKIAPGSHFMSLGGPQSRFGDCGENKHFLPLPELERRPSTL
jgi:hypothetical protein